MGDQSDNKQSLHTRRIETIHSLTELNSQHIKTQSQLSGLEIETARCEEVMNAGNRSTEVEREMQRLELEISQIMQTRALIDQKRDALELTLAELDNKLTGV